MKIVIFTILLFVSFRCFSQLEAKPEEITIYLTLTLEEYSELLKEIGYEIEKVDYKGNEVTFLREVKSVKERISIEFDSSWETPNRVLILSENNRMYLEYLNKCEMLFEELNIISEFDRIFKIRSPIKSMVFFEISFVDYERVYMFMIERQN